MLFIPDDRGTLRSINCTFVTGDALLLARRSSLSGPAFYPCRRCDGWPEGGWPVVLDYGFWLANYHGDPEIIGKHTFDLIADRIIVGVTSAQLYWLLVGDRQNSTSRALRLRDRTFARPGPLHAHGQIFRICHRTAADEASRSPHSMQNLQPQVLPSCTPSFRRQCCKPPFHNATLAAQSARRGFSYLDSEYRQPLFLLQGVVLLVLLLCCINLGGLQLAHVQARQHEFAVRSALGAGRGRLLQQCLTESLLLALTGRCWPLASPGPAPLRWVRFSPPPHRANRRAPPRYARAPFTTRLLCLPHCSSVSCRHGSRDTPRPGCFSNQREFSSAPTHSHAVSSFPRSLRLPWYLC